MDAAPNRQNSDTTYGLAVTAGVIKESRASELNRVENTRLAIEGKQRAESKRVARRDKLSLALDNALYALSGATARERIRWDKLTGNKGLLKADTVRQALEEWTGKKMIGKAAQVSTILGYLFLRTRTAILISAVFQRRYSAPLSLQAPMPTLALGAGDDDDELEY